jgi:hypothetical protein
MKARSTAQNESKNDGLDDFAPLGERRRRHELYAEKS